MSTGGPTSPSTGHRSRVLFPQGIHKVSTRSLSREKSNAADPSRVNRSSTHLALGIIEVCRHRHHSVLNTISEVCFSGFLHFAEDHGRNLLWGEYLLLPLDIHLNIRLALLTHNVVRQQLGVLLYRGVCKPAQVITFSVYSMLRFPKDEQRKRE